MIGIGGLFAAVEAATGRDAALDNGENVVQKRGIGEGTGEGEGVRANSLGRFQETAVRERPATHEEEPVLDDHGEEFRENLREGVQPGYV